MKRENGGAYDEVKMKRGKTVGALAFIRLFRAGHLGALHLRDLTSAYTKLPLSEAVRGATVSKPKPQPQRPTIPALNHGQIESSFHLYDLLTPTSKPALRPRVMFYISGWSCDVQPRLSYALASRGCLWSLEEASILKTRILVSRAPRFLVI
jgi:hypothetical protein